MKKLFSILTIIFIFAFPNVVSATTKEYYIDNVNIQAEILQNGDVNVTENLGYDFNGDFNGIFRNLKLNNTLGYKISEVYSIDENGHKQLISEADNEADYTYKLIDNGDSIQIKVFCPSSNEKKSFFFNYTIEKAAKKYSDLSQLYWNFYTVENVSSIKEGSLNLSLNNSNFDSSVFHYDVFGDGDFETTYNDKSVSVNFKNLTSLLGIKLNFQKEFLNDIPEINSTAPTEVESQYQSSTDLNGKCIAFIALFISLGLGGIGFGFFINKLKFKKELEKYRSKFTFIPNEIYVEPPSSTSPALIDLLMNEKVVSKEILTPTLFYLVKKGYYTISESTYYSGKNKSNNLKEDLIFTRVHSKGLPKENHLVFLIDWFSMYEVNGSFSLQKIKKRIQSQSEAQKFINKLNEWIAEVFEDADSYTFFKTIGNKRILRNKYYNEKLKWLSYKNYLINSKENLEHKNLTNIDDPLIYATALDIDYDDIKVILNSLSKDIKRNSSEIPEFSYLYCNNYLFYSLLVNDITGDAHINIDNSPNSTSSSFGGFSSGSGFTGGGGGGSGAF
ncbi:DUF2207 domain-containing protein [Clostridium septicum]|uniref:DUF2207 domain-containing protein n=1 Tax=Clostridium septicum TaxID=1504 RepID=UPI00082B5A9B|nr:DUF2207 domain-containing protein [Clostridium septicum]WLF68338.1 DUF2207 domain-containing protein [Clostridium septicum]